MSRKRIRIRMPLILLVILIGFTAWVIKSLNFGNSNVKVNDSDSIKASNSNVSSDIKAEAAIAIDEKSGKVLYSKNINEKLYPASTTKLMTALLFTRKMNKNSVLTYSAKAKSQEPDKMDYRVGTKIDAQNVLRAMLIYSANDMAYTAAENTSGSASSFVDAMNEEAKKLGMKNTHYSNPTGLHYPNHYTTVKDMSVLAREVYKNNWIMSTIDMPTANVKTESGTTKVIYNTNQLLNKDGCFAGKTGFTSEAGRCLVAYVKKKGKTLICIVLKSPDQKTLYTDMESLINAV